MIHQNNGHYNGKVQIDGREYLTVAYRLAAFRAKYPIESGWGIETQCLSSDEEKVTFRATIKNPENKIVATGHAQEKRNSSEINKTSAYENCETSAIGRVLASAGFIGSEFASAEEVALAIQTQANTAEPQEQDQANQEASPEQAEPSQTEAKPESQEAKQSAEPKSKEAKQAEHCEAQSQTEQNEETEQAEQNQEISQPDEERAERWARENLEEWVYDPCPFAKAQGRTWLQLAKNEGDKITVRGKPALPRAYLHAIESWETGGVWPRMKARVALEVGKNGNGN